MNKIIKLLLTIDGFRIFAFGLLGPIYAIFVKDIGGDILDVGLAFAIYSIVLGILSYIVGSLSDKYINPIKLMFSGYLLISISFFLYIFVRNPFDFIFTQIILGIGTALAFPTFDTFYSTYLDKKKKNTEWGSWEAELHIFTGISAIVGAIIVKYFGFKILFFIMGVMQLFSVFFIYLLYQTVNNKFNHLLHFLKIK